MCFDLLGLKYSFCFSFLPESSQREPLQLPIFSMKSADWYQHHMIQAHNQISHFHALRSASGMDWIPAGRGRGKGYLNPPNPQLLKLFSLRLLRPNTPNLLKPGHRNQSQRKYLRSRAFNVISLSLKFCFRLMLRLGDRVCTRACVLAQFCMSVWHYWMLWRFLTCCLLNQALFECEP